MMVRYVIIPDKSSMTCLSVNKPAFQTTSVEFTYENNLYQSCIIIVRLYSQSIAEQ